MKSKAVAIQLGKAALYWLYVPQGNISYLKEYCGKAEVGATPFGYIVGLHSVHPGIRNHLPQADHPLLDQIQEAEGVAAQVLFTFSTVHNYLRQW